MIFERSKTEIIKSHKKLLAAFGKILFHLNIVSFAFVSMKHHPKKLVNRWQQHKNALKT